MVYVDAIEYAKLCKLFYVVETLKERGFFDGNYKDFTIDNPQKRLKETMEELNEFFNKK